MLEISEHLNLVLLLVVNCNKALLNNDQLVTSKQPNSKISQVFLK